MVFLPTLGGVDYTNFLGVTDGQTDSGETYWPLTIVTGGIIKANHENQELSHESAIIAPGNLNCSDSYCMTILTVK